MSRAARSWRLTRAGALTSRPASRRVEEYSKTLREKYGVKFYDSIEEMCKDVDAVLLESVDGRPHLEQVKPVLQARKPVFIDKPMAASLQDVIEIFRLAKEAKVPVFSSSSLRFARDTQAVRNGSIGKVTYAETYGPCELEPHHPDLFWYGVHGVESLFTIMGTGCQTVQRQTTPDGKIEVVGTWSGGRKGIFREDKNFHGLAKGEKGEAAAGSFDGYEPLVAAIMTVLPNRRGAGETGGDHRDHGVHGGGGREQEPGRRSGENNGCVPGESR